MPDNYSLGDAVQAIMDTEKTLNLPVDITTQFQGSTLAFQSALGSTVWLIVAAVVAMYIVLGILYESFIHPITILDATHRRGRRAAGVSHSARQRMGCDCHYRHYFADRYREEERHHDD